MIRAAFVLACVLFAQSAHAACIALADGDVLQAPHGYIIHSLNAFVQHELAKPSGDDLYWICANDRGDVDFYAPRDPAEDDEETAEWPTP